jgi:hypothetical protein
MGELTPLETPSLFAGAHTIRLKYRLFHVLSNEVSVQNGLRLMIPSSLRGKASRACCLVPNPDTSQQQPAAQLLVQRVVAVAHRRLRHLPMTSKAMDQRNRIATAP